MIFSREAIEKIKTGEKMATTRKSGRYRAGRLYAIQPGRGKRAVGYIKIVAEPEIVTLCLERRHGKMEREYPWLRLWKHATRYYHEEGFDERVDFYIRLFHLRLDKHLAAGKDLYFYRFKYVGKERG